VSRSQPRSEHTPTPWHCDETAIFAEDGVLARIPNHPENGKNWNADAAFIVDAVNSHATLKARVAELEGVLQFIADGYDNHDVNHVDYRVKVYQVATEALSQAGPVARDGER
jgi:hypothetical protein